MEQTRRNLSGLKARQYEHDLDRKALSALEGTPGLEILVRKFNEYALEKILRVQFTGSSIKVTPSNFSEIHTLYMETCEVLDMEKIPELYMQWGYQINAFTSGVEKPIVVLNSGCIDLMTRDELAFIIGHELGHVKSAHVLYHQMAQVIPILGDLLGKATLGIGEILSTGLQLALLHWQRMSEFTCDRAGLLACQNSEAAVGTFIKMAGVPIKYHNSFVVDDFINQAKGFEELSYDTLSKVAKFITIMGQTHPWVVLRAAEMLKWMDGPVYTGIVQGTATMMNGGDAASDLPFSFCFNCGAKRKADANFCGECGTKLVRQEK